MKYEVTVVRFGSVYVEANSEEEAMNIANNQRTGDVCWDELWEPTSAQEDEFPEKHYHVKE